MYQANRLLERIRAIFIKGLEKDNRKQRIVINSLRHSFASLLAIGGTPILTIKKLMNHKDIATTMIYAHLAPNNGREEVEKLGM